MALNLQSDWIEITLREKIPALKNDRTYNNPKLTKTHYSKAEVQALINLSRVNRPAPAVEQFILKTKDRIRQYMATNGLNVIKKPLEVCVFLKLGVAYQGALPSSDNDNAYSTVQETLFTRIKEGMRGSIGPLLEDDNQVADMRCLRVKSVNSDLIYSKLYVTVIGTEAYTKLKGNWDTL